MFMPQYNPKTGVHLNDQRGKDEIDIGCWGDGTPVNWLNPQGLTREEGERILRATDGQLHVRESILPSHFKDYIFQPVRAVREYWIFHLDGTLEPLYTEVVPGNPHYFGHKIKMGRFVRTCLAGYCTCGKHQQ